ncbi:MAG: DUF4249 family protein [Candidatus Zhuqueibacterota bacterium]
MIKKICILKIILAALFIQCSPDMSLDVDKTLGRLQVLSVISPAFERAEVYIGMAYPESAPENISGAEVILSDSLNEIVLIEVQPGLYQDLSNSLNVEPKVKYHLHVQISDGKTYSDNTIVPPIPEISNCNDGDTLHIYFSSMGNKIPTIKFKKDDFTYGYLISTIISNNDEEIYTTIKTDSLETEMPIPSWGINWFSDTLFYQPAKLQTWALDSAAMRIDNQSVLEAGSKIKWNLFGSMSMSEINVTVEMKLEAGK